MLCLMSLENLAIHLASRLSLFSPSLYLALLWREICWKLSVDNPTLISLPWVASLETAFCSHQQNIPKEDSDGPGMGHMLIPLSL